MSKRWASTVCLNNERGQNLLAVLIGVSVMAVVLLQMGSAFQLMNANSNSLKGKMGSLSVTSSLTQIIAKPANCMSHLSVTTLDPVAAATSTGAPVGFSADDGTSVFQGPPPVAGATPWPVPNYSVSVNYLVFKNALSQGTDQNAGPTFGATIYLGQLVAGLLKMANAGQQVSGGRGLQDIGVGSMYFELDSTNTIVACYAQTVTLIQACTSLGGTYIANPTPPNTNCELPYPCNQGLVFMGYDGSQNPICNSAAAVSVLTCPAGHTVVSNGTGYVCN